jgi:5-methylcytosine-specific restriction enzyme subunit McrC
LPRYGRTVCVFDELEHDTPANRIIRATLTLLMRSPLVEDELRHELVALRRNFRDVSEVRVTALDCRRVTVHRNNRHYGVLLELCELILGSLLPDESGRGMKFRDFSREHQAMARMFEQFVKNFYVHHAGECGITRVSSKLIAWAGQPDDAASKAGWPGMRTDICIERTGQPLVIDCKFYHDPLAGFRGGREKLGSAHLYQLFSYVENLAREPGWAQVEGLLLYAQSGTPFAFSHSACGRRLTAISVDLASEWPEIHARLVAAVGATEKVPTSAR